ncbi:MAG: DUF4261 domain-containing protein [Planctomycetota bacterium]
MSDSSPWLALVALSDELLPSPDAIAAQLAERFPDAAAFGATSETDRAVTFRFGEATGNLTLVDRPIPWSQIEGPCAVAWYWPEAEQAMRSHTTHLFLTLIDAAKDPVDRATHLTQLTTAVAATTPSVGIVWGPSSQVHKPVDFAVTASTMAPSDLPLHLWIDFRISQLGDGQLGDGQLDDGQLGEGQHAAGAFTLFTTGMEALGHREFEVARFEGEPQQLAGVVYNIAHYVLESVPGKGRPVLNDGEAVGLPDDKQVNVRIEASQIDPEQEVVRLEFE